MNLQGGIKSVRNSNGNILFWAKDDRHRPLKANRRKSKTKIPLMQWRMANRKSRGAKD